ncbi:cupin-like domain-containing protein [Sphingomonas oryzagri]
MAGHVAEIDRGATGDEAWFACEVVSRCEPVVLRGYLADWPVVRAARTSGDESFDYLRSLDSGATAQAFVGDSSLGGRYAYGSGPDGFNFTRETLGIGDVLDRIASRIDHPDLPTIYMGSISADEFLPGFAAQNPIALLPQWVRPRIWLGCASNVACHYDTFDNLACVAAGARRFTLYPPDAIGDLYVGPIDHTLAGQPIALAAGAPAGDPRFPRFEAARERALVVELEPGDALFLPKLWWHQVEALAPFNLLVNYWWDAFSGGPDAPYTAMMLTMIAIAERPPQERAAWRAFFDHYVFRPERHPLAHMPEEQHGVLGPLRPHNYGRIRAMIMRWLRGD